QRVAEAEVIFPERTRPVYEVHVLGSRHAASKKLATRNSFPAEVLVAELTKRGDVRRCRTLRRAPGENVDDRLRGETRHRSAPHMLEPNRQTDERLLDSRRLRLEHRGPMRVVRR